MSANNTLLVRKIGKKYYGWDERLSDENQHLLGTLAHKPVIIENSSDNLLLACIDYCKKHLVEYGVTIYDEFKRDLKEKLKK